MSFGKKPGDFRVHGQFLICKFCGSHHFLPVYGDSSHFSRGKKGVSRREYKNDRAYIVESSDVHVKCTIYICNEIASLLVFYFLLCVLPFLHGIPCVSRIQISFEYVESSFHFHRARNLHACWDGLMSMSIVPLLTT